jgi:hypothetical protein
VLVRGERDQHEHGDEDERPGSLALQRTLRVPHPACDRADVRHECIASREILEERQVVRARRERDDPELHALASERVERLGDARDVVGCGVEIADEQDRAARIAGPNEGVMREYQPQGDLGAAGKAARPRIRRRPVGVRAAAVRARRTAAGSAAPATAFRVAATGRRCPRMRPAQAGFAT